MIVLLFIIFLVFRIQILCIQYTVHANGIITAEDDYNGTYTFSSNERINDKKNIVCFQVIC